MRRLYETPYPRRRRREATGIPRAARCPREDYSGCPTDAVAHSCLLRARLLYRGYGRDYANEETGDPSNVRRSDFPQDVKSVTIRPRADLNEEGRMEELTTLLEKSRSELEARALFAEKFPLEENYASALATFSSWDGFITSLSAGE